ncbi:MAG: hypothetical protein H0W76_07865 [Pyrinomonadaceae bacterium]|nr:hypothetical protein [Pyrinomonadaceae bacterium]
MSDKTPEPKPKRCLVFVEELSREVERLKATNAGLAGTVDELHAALLKLVEACEAGGTSRYIEALGRARRLLDVLDAAQKEKPPSEVEKPNKSSASRPARRQK